MDKVVDEQGRRAYKVSSDLELSVDFTLLYFLAVCFNQTERALFALVLRMTCERRQRLPPVHRISWQSTTHLSRHLLSIGVSRECRG